MGWLFQRTVPIKRRQKPRVESRIKNYIHEYEAFICQFISFGNIWAIGGKISIQMELPDLMYTAIRCALLHGDDIEDWINLEVKDGIIGVKNGKPIVAWLCKRFFILSCSRYCKRK